MTIRTYDDGGVATAAVIYEGSAIVGMSPAPTPQAQSARGQVIREQAALDAREPVPLSITFACESAVCGATSATVIPGKRLKRRCQCGRAWVKWDGDSIYHRGCARLAIYEVA